jgi:very-short-patch-repair endonuclease
VRGSGETEYKARQLRRRMSTPELKLWFAIRDRHPGKPTFRRQHAIGPYIADFYCAKASLVVEIDGAAHGWNEAAIAHDRARDAYMRRLGLRVLRIPAVEVFADCDGLAERLRRLAFRIAKELGRL